MWVLSRDQRIALISAFTPPHCDQQQQQGWRVMVHSYTVTAVVLTVSYTSTESPFGNICTRRLCLFCPMAIVCVNLGLGRSRAQLVQLPFCSPWSEVGSFLSLHVCRTPIPDSVQPVSWQCLCLIAVPESVRVINLIRCFVCVLHFCQQTRWQWICFFVSLFLVSFLSLVVVVFWGKEVCVCVGGGAVFVFVFICLFGLVCVIFLVCLQYFGDI